MTFAETEGRKPYRYERPPFGEFGSLAMVGERIVCHLCGRDFLDLSVHIRRTHGMTAFDYRATFGLLRGQRLVSESGLATRSHTALVHKSLKPATKERLAELRVLAHEALREPRLQRTRILASIRVPMTRKPTLHRWHPGQSFPDDECPKGHKWDGYTHKRSNGTRVRKCRQCNRDQAAKWRRDNPEAFKAQRARSRRRSVRTSAA